MISSRLEFERGFQRFPVVIEPGATVYRTIQALAGLPPDATLVGNPPLEPGQIAYPQDIFTLAEGKLLFTPNLRQCEMPLEDRGVELTRIENSLLFALARTEGSVCERRTLIDQIWDGVAGEKSTDSHMSNLRRKLGGDISPYIKTLRGVGFILVKQL